MNARNFLELAQKGRYEANKELLMDLGGLCASNPYQLASLIKKFHVSQPVGSPSFYVDKAELARAAIQFHEQAGTFTENVQKNIKLLTTNAPILRIAHTPDHFAYIGVYAQFIFQDITARTLITDAHIFPCQIYVNLNCDVADDARLRVSYVPDIERKHGGLGLSVPIPCDSYPKIIRAVEKPSEDVVKEWISLLGRFVKHYLTLLYRGGTRQKKKGHIESIKAWLYDIEREMWEAHHRSENLGEFNTIFLSRIINLHWKLPTAFVSSPQIAPVMKDCYEYLLSEYPRLVELSNTVVDLLQTNGIEIKDSVRARIDSFPLWYICQACFSRVHLKISSCSQLALHGVCPGCGSEFRADVGTFAKPNLEPIYDKVIPKVLFDDLTDIIGWKISGGVHYLGGIGHTLPNILTANKFGLHVPPECLWRPRGIYYGLPEVRVGQILEREGHEHLSKEALQALYRVYYGRASILYGLFSQGFEGLYAMWKHHFESGKQTHEVNIAYNPFAMSDRQMSLLEREIYQFDDTLHRMRSD